MTPSSTADIVGDVLLIVVLWCMLWLPKRLRKVIVSIFAASILTANTGLVHFVFMFVEPRALHNDDALYSFAMVAHLKVCVFMFALPNFPSRNEKKEKFGRRTSLLGHRQH